MSSTRAASALTLLLAAWPAVALQDAPGQPLKAGKPLTFEEVGQSAVSAQQVRAFVARRYTRLSPVIFLFLFFRLDFPRIHQESNTRHFLGSDHTINHGHF